MTSLRPDSRPGSPPRHLRRPDARTRATRTRRPLVVSFSGLDGAGKTRQIDALTAALENESSVELLWVPFKIWPEGVLNRLPAGVRGRLGPRRRSTSSVEGDVPPAPRPDLRRSARSAVWWGVATLAAVSGGLSLRRRGGRGDADVLVLDRYRLDTIVKLQFWYHDVPGPWLARIVSALAPAPDVEFLLRLDPETAYRRKPEQWSVDQLARQAQLYDELSARRPEVVVLPAENDPDDISRTVRMHLRSVRDGR